MENIFYLDAKNAIDKFWNNEFPSCPNKLKGRFFNFFNNIVNYEEEGEKLNPQLLFTNNIDLIARSIPDSYKVVLFTDDNETDFDSRMKALLPFTAKDWWVFINVKDNEYSYGIIKVTNSIKDDTFKELLLSNSKLKDKIDKVEVIMVQPFSRFVVNFISIKGNEMNINFSIDPDFKLLDPTTEIRKFTDASFSKLKTTAKKLTDIKNMYVHIFGKVSKSINGAICVVVDKDYVDNGFFSDGVWLKEPISFSKVFLNTKSYSETKLDTVANLLMTMLDSDGITIVDNTGRIRAYNVFVETNIEKTKNITGGARKRAAYTIINSRRKKIIGVYFQSHEGEIFYADVKGSVKPKVKKLEKEPNFMMEEQEEVMEETIEEITEDNE